MPPIARPTGVEKTFGVNDVIVTKTDLKGHITYANDIFCRMAAMTEAEVMGQPHNLIRHPDMPGGVFRLLWDSLQNGQEIFAYVVNLAADGSHYWVYAHVTPTADASGRIVGYHSNRRSPSRAGVRLIEPIYRAMLAQERHSSRAAESAALGLTFLQDRLAERGQSYEEFIWSLTAESVA
jgi:PAS domain S-box-containing protein